jgi:hypothetical protein
VSLFAGTAAGSSKIIHVLPDIKSLESSNFNQKLQPTVIPAAVELCILFLEREREIECWSPPRPRTTLLHTPRLQND